MGGRARQAGKFYYLKAPETHMRDLEFIEAHLCRDLMLEVAMKLNFKDDDLRIT